jgi:hypothetical protein
LRIGAIGSLCLMGIMTAKSFKELIAWQKAFNVSLAVHQLVEGMPREHRCGLCAELMKTSRSGV